MDLEVRGRRKVRGGTKVKWRKERRRKERK